MRTLCLVALVVVVVSVLFARIRAQDLVGPIATSPRLPALEQLQAENHLLRVRVAELEAQLAESTARLRSVVLTEERAKLVEDFRKAMKADHDAEFDWQHLVFVPKPPPAAAVKPKEP